MKNTLFSAEWKAIFKNKKLLIPLIAIMFIPVLYSGMFLWAFWDPYDRLADLPVAVINMDEGAEFEGEQLQLGDDLVDKLLENDQFTFDIVDEKQGYRDLEKQKYYLLIEIPNQFSKNATTLLDEKPQKLELNYIPNESFNFLSAQIGETAVEKIKSAVAKEVSATYAETMFDKVKEMADGFEQASDGAHALNEGALELSSGSDRLYENLNQLASKSLEFNQGMSQVQAGIEELAKGTNELANGLGQLVNGHEQIVQGAQAANDGATQLTSGAKSLAEGLQQTEGSTEKLVTGTGQIKAGADQLTSKLGEFQSGAGQVAEGANALHDGILQMKSQLAGIDEKLSALPIPDEMKLALGNQLKAELEAGIEKLAAGSASVADGTKQLEASAGELQAGAGTIANKLAEVNAGQKQLTSGLSQLTVGSNELVAGVSKLEDGQSQLTEGILVFDQKLREANAGAGKLTTGASQLAGGIDTLADGSNQLSDGSRQLADGSSELAKGTKKLVDGTNEIDEKLSEAANQSSSVHADEQTYDMIGEPVKVENKGINHVPNYGTGFAPYFLSLGLFVGALLITIVFPLREPASQPKNGFAWFFGKFGVIAIVGIIQSLLSVAIMLFGLQMEVESIPLFIITTIATSLSFIALIQFLVTLFADPGRFIAIIILILQLTTSAGTFPLELIPAGLQPFNAMLPMTYSVQAYKAVISSGDFSYMWKNISILSAYLIVFIGLTIGYFQFKFKRQFGYKVSE
ncbi:YhgE/Pip domain-containing protein [Bacillus sp. FJAT-50079]|uniref:YhgE/Pip domain-containing protein n=1 Tax=Bacillus sp. FJAT-50079 TaxID=2833577 RepID=UPI001BC90958|nr:YhgE/Pip domain-containing protein [Bacillus sp. FJAT-50079]MBS4207903.1 YhgE/Pip domain-containing protein [Bacillus sp. FJAT-50079]